MTAFNRLPTRMKTKFRPHASLHLLGERATRPVEPRCGTLAALLLLAGKGPLRRRALPTHRITTHSGVSNYGFQVKKKNGSTREPFFYRRGTVFKRQLLP
ncbi:hypothetical protein [Uliginosibacterium flavum]|uniref:Uncharacterized protein n=1 Tax=Uliginosibacterium flavum TaxID=1396831 RepID=A0ABV2TMT4_9RHOO